MVVVPANVSMATTIADEIRSMGILPSFNSAGIAPPRDKLLHHATVAFYPGTIYRTSSNLPVCIWQRIFPLPNFLEPARAKR
jgi:hypothetical protein